MSIAGEDDPELRPSDYVRTALRVLGSLRERLVEPHTLAVTHLDRDTVSREITQAETSLRRVLHLIGG